MDRAADDQPGGTVRHGARLALGTLTVLPVRAPRVDRTTAGTAMSLAPLVGLLLALPCAVLVWLLGYGPGGGQTWHGLSGHRPSPLVVAALTVALLAALTRALHLDGLADTADGLGSGRPAGQALEVMRSSDIGPFGVVTLLLVLLVQVGALADLLTGGRAVPALAVALVVSRLVLPMACLRSVPAARPDGLGAAVAGSVSPAGFVVSAVLAAGGLAVAGAGVLLVGDTELAGGSVLATLVTVVLSLGVGALFLRRCVRRFGGVTGDVLGGAVEVTFTAVLLLLALVL